MTLPTARRLRRLSAVGALSLALAACAGGNAGDEPSADPGSSSPSASETTSAAPSPSPSTPGTTETSTVAVYEDFACPHCKDFHAQAGGFLLSLEQEGQAEVEYRIVDFLGRGDPESWSTRAAQAYYCFRESTSDAGKLHGYQSQLFEAAPQGVDDAQLVQRAEQMDEDIAACVEGDGAADQIQSALSEMSDGGIRGVPSISVDDTLYDAETDGDFFAWVRESAGVTGG